MTLIASGGQQLQHEHAFVMTASLHSRKLVLFFFFFHWTSFLSFHLQGTCSNVFEFMLVTFSSCQLAATISNAMQKLA